MCSIPCCPQAGQIFPKLPPTMVKAEQAWCNPYSSSSFVSRWMNPWVLHSQRQIVLVSSQASFPVDILLASGCYFRTARSITSGLHPGRWYLDWWPRFRVTDPKGILKAIAVKVWSPCAYQRVWLFCVDSQTSGSGSGDANSMHCTAYRLWQRYRLSRKDWRDLNCYSVYDSLLVLPCPGIWVFGFGGV